LKRGGVSAFKWGKKGGNCFIGKRKDYFIKGGMNFKGERPMEKASNKRGITSKRRGKENPRER